MRLPLPAIVAALIFGIGLVSQPLPAMAQGGQIDASQLNPQQFETVVRAVNEDMARQVLNKGQDGAAADAAKAARPSAGGESAAAPSAADSLEQGFSKGAGTFLKKLQATIAVYPKFGITFQQVSDALTRSGTRPVGDFLLLLFGAAFGALIAEYAVRRLLAAFAARGVTQALVADVAGVIAFLAVIHIADGVLVAGNDVQSRLAEISSIALVTWRLFSAAFRVVLRPGQPALRMARIDDQAASRLFMFFSAATAIILFVRLWGRLGRASGVTPDAQLATTLLSILIVTVFMVVGFRWVRSAMTAWLQSLIAPTAIGARFKDIVASHWAEIATIFYVATSLSFAYGAVIGRHGIGTGVNNTLVALAALLFLETAIDHVAGWRNEAPAKDKVAEPAPLEALAKCLRMAARIGILVLLVESWAVRSLGVLTETEWNKAVNAVDSAAFALFGAYVAWQVMLYFVQRYEARNPVVLSSGEGDGDGEPPATASRLRTLMPVLKFTIGALIIVIATLLALAEMGVNIAPLLAGASIFGLAISFGSQSLVKDIVAGIFYLADDAFRIGEYIDTGKQKGTVEGFTLRSIKLRHQNGQLHTIPFGQLGSVTNFSRDWTTIKFNLRFDRGIDIELLRKTTKKIGQEMMQDPALKDEFLEPLKMQGIADITDNAIVARFKMTLRPVKPTFVQRQAVKRMYQVFPEKGLNFAKATVSVQTLGGATPDAAALAAAATANTPSASQ